MNNITKGSPIGKIIRFSIPLMIGNFFQLVYNMVDTFIVGRTLGVDALAGIGMSGSLMFFIIGFAQGFTSGTAIPVAQAFGAEDYPKIRRSVALNIYLVLIISIILTILSTFYLKDILEFLKTPQEIIQYSYDYMIIIFSGMIVVVLFNMVSNLLRAIGNSRTPVVALAITTITNIILDYLFIVYFNMGVAGAAYATVSAQLIAVIICIYVIHKHVPELQVRLNDFKIVGEEFLHHCRLGFPMGFQASIIAVGSVSVTIALNTLGPGAVAGYSAASKIDQIIILVLMSFGIAMATYVGQNFGAKEFHRIIIGVRQTTYVSLAVAILSGIILWFLGGPLTALFGDAGSQDVLHAYGKEFFQLTVPFYGLLAILFIYRNTLQGLNNSFIPTIAGILELIMRVLAAFVLTEYIGFAGTVISNPMAWLGALLALVPAYYKYRQKLVLAEETGEFTT